MADALTDAVAVAVDCPEEPLIGPPAPGDIEIRFRPKGPTDVGDLAVVVEVRTKRFESRRADKQRRADLIRDRLAELDVGTVGVWLTLVDGAWSQT